MFAKKNWFFPNSSSVFQQITKFKSTFLLSLQKYQAFKSSRTVFKFSEYLVSLAQDPAFPSLSTPFVWLRRTADDIVLSSSHLKWLLKPHDVDSHTIFFKVELN